MAAQAVTTPARLAHVYYTVCPVKVASHLAMHQGYFDQALAREGVQYTHISTLPPAQWAVHYTHEHPSFCRDGGNIPPLWTRARGVDTVLVGLSFSQRRQAILVAREAAITRVAELRGKRLSLPQRADEIDFFRAMAHRGFLATLHHHGIGAEEVEFVDVPVTKAMSAEAGGGSVWSAKSDPTLLFGEEVAALLAGTIDAIYQSGGRVAAILATGALRSLYDISSQPDLWSRVNNCDPAVITVSGTLARHHPRVVVRYLEATLRGAAWARHHPEETMRIIAKETFVTADNVRASFPPNLHETLAPTLAEEGLTALEIQKQFLLEHGYIERDFSLHDWADPSFLEAAQANLEAGNP